MVRFSDLNKNRPGNPDLPASDGQPISPALKENGDTPLKEISGGESSADRLAIYEDASFYLGKVFSAVKERKPFALDPGFRIMRQVVTSYSPQDTLFVKAIQLDDRLNYLINKCVNVGIYSVRLAEQLAYPREKQVEIGMAGLLHEVGMCLIPEKILAKKEQLTRKEFEIIQQHSEFGYEILKAYSDSYPYLAEVALQVHERIDGSGYPQGLKGDEINEYAQIVGLVDIYEALSHSRPQRDRFDHFYAIKEIIKTCKTKFRKKHLKALLNAFSIFPLSTYVRLNSNAVGKVIETYPDQPMRPRLRIEYDSQGRRVLTERIVNLPENSLLYIVDSVSEDEIRQLESGHPLRKSPEALDGRNFPPPGKKKESESKEGAPKQSFSTSTPKNTKERRTGTRPLLGLLLLVLLIGGIPFWQGLQPVASSSTRNAVSSPPAAGEAAAVKKGIPATDAEKTRMIPVATAANAPEKVEPAAAEGIGRLTAVGRSERFPGPEVGGADEAPAPRSTPVSMDMERKDSESAFSPPTEAGNDAGRPVPAAADRFRDDASSAVRYPYSILLASFRSAARAEQAMSIYREKGIDPYLVRVDLGEDGIWFRLFCGQYATRKKAAAAADKLPVEGVLVKPTRYANRIALQGPAQDPGALVNRLKALGYFPYRIANGSGGHDLFVGAFYTEKGARQQHAELIARGIDNRVVRR